MTFTTFIQHGLFDLPWWGYVLYTFVLTHITILAVTIFLHRHQAHRALDLHPAVSHFFRFWLWLTTSMVTKEWASIHRKHHAFSDKEGDPHSPVIYGIKKVFFEGAELYREESRNQETLTKYGNGTPDDWLEREVYSGRNTYGIVTMLILNVILFGPIGLSIWAVQMLWIPVNAAGVINGIAHFWGYRNFSNSDNSRNIFPIGFLIGGEELHNNHHTFGTSAKLSYKWYEFDVGWMWIQILAHFKLATVKRSIPVLNTSNKPKLIPDLQTLETIVSNRYNLILSYSHTLKEECQKEMNLIKQHLTEKVKWAKLKTLLSKDHEQLTVEEHSLLQKISEHSPILKKIISMRADLTTLWQRSHLTKDELLHSLQNWCKRAEASNIEKLRFFSMNLRASY